MFVEPRGDSHCCPLWWESEGVGRMGMWVWTRSGGSEHEGCLALGKEMGATGGVGAEE